MRSKGRVVGTLVAALAVAAVAVTAAAGAHRADPGVTKTSIKIGGTFPLTGVASLYGIIPLAEKAYFDYVNDKGGVNGRKIDFTMLDDQYDPSKTVPLTQQLVESDKVFADFGSLGTAPNLAIRSYLNQKHVPQVLIATGDSFWGAQYKKYPWTIGWQPDYPGESKIYGKFINSKVPQAKIGVLYQNDAYGINYLNGLKAGLGKAASDKIVSTQPFDVTAPDVTQQMLALKASGANVFFDFATPSPSIKALVTAAKIGWHPDATFVNNVSASTTFMKLAGAAGASVDGDISTSYLVSGAVPEQANLAGVKLAKAIIAKYNPKLDVTNDLTVYGFAVAWNMVWALQHAGNPPTRAGLMKAIRSMPNLKDPFVYPGITLSTSPTDGFPLEQQVLIRWGGGAAGHWTPFGKLFNKAR